MHFALNGPTVKSKENIEAFRTALTKRGGPADPKAEFSGGCAIGVSRQIVVADTEEEEARAIDAPATQHLYENLTYLLRVHTNSDFVKRLNIPGSPDFDQNVKMGTLIAGTPETLVAQIREQVATLLINYLIYLLFLGCMTLLQALRSLQLFKTEVMPKIADL